MWNTWDVTYCTMHVLRPDAFFFIIHVIYCWQVQVSVNNSPVWELHQHNTSVPSIERDMKAWASSTIVGYKWKTTRLQSTSTLEREGMRVRDMERERENKKGEAGWGCAPCLRACGSLCWVIACQQGSLLKSGDEWSQMLWPYYGKETGMQWKRSACGMDCRST